MTTEHAGDLAGKATQPEPSYLELLARVKAVLAECENDPEKIRHHFGFIEFSEGDL